MSERNKIVYVGGKDSQNFRIRKFTGYGQVLQICYGDEKCVAVAWPEDSKFGVSISGLI